MSTVRLHWDHIKLSDIEYLDNIRLSTVIEIIVDATREIFKVMTRAISTVDCVREILKVNVKTVNQYLDKLPFFSVWPSSNRVKSVFLQTDLRILGNV